MPLPKAPTLVYESGRGQSGNRTNMFREDICCNDGFVPGVQLFHEPTEARSR